MVLFGIRVAGKTDAEKHRQKRNPEGRQKRRHEGDKERDKDGDKSETKETEKDITEKDREKRDPPDPCLRETR